MSKDSGIVNIHGKEYQTVAFRVGKFREKHYDWSLKTEVVQRSEEFVVMLATIADETGRVRATGHSEEYRKASQINKTSALENAETSAIGRALAALGMGGTEFASADEVANAIGGTEFASADEVANAIGQQKASVKAVTADEWDKLDTETQKWLGTIADGVKAEIASKGGAAAVKLLEEQGLSQEHKVAIWSQFDSRERAAMKKKEAA